jgi:nitrate reductase gamma subunit
MTLDALLILVTYTCVFIFLASVITRFVKIARLPIHVRWELYPVAHERGRASYGGSRLEELDWWTKPQQKSMLGELKVMVPEILLLAGVRHKNPSQWLRSFPFHFGLYLFIGASFLLIGGGIATALGAEIGPGAGWLGRLVGTLTPIFGFGGLGLGLMGATALFLRRLLNTEYREFTAPGDFVNLLFFVAAFGVALVAQATGDADFSRMRGFFAGVATFGSHAPAEGVTSLMAVSVVMVSLLAAYVPLTHMSHFFTKYFMYHDIRWSDEPMVRGGKLEGKMMGILGMKPTWSAPHIQGDGVKTWVDIATSNGIEEEAADKTTNKEAAK